MRILFVTQKFPYPLDNGGNVRSYNLLRGLAQEHEVTLLATDSGDVLEEHLLALRPFCREIRLVRVRKTGLFGSAILFARSLVGAAPFVLLRHTERGVHREIRSIFAAKERAFDAVHFNHLDTTLYEPDVPPGVLRIVDEHNVVANQVKTTLPAETRFPHKLILRHELPKLSAFEARVCNLMDLCLVCSDDDEKALRELGVVSPIAVIPNGADLEYFRPLSMRPAGSREITFVGTLDYDPCEKGVWYCCTQILPLIRQQVPDIRFVVVGRNPSRRLRDLAAADANIVLTGRVEDIRPHVQRAGAFVVPLLSGSGTRLKIIEAMAMGVPVISTTVGAEGIAARSGVHLHIADDPASFSRAVIHVLQDSQDASSLSNHARALVENQYGWPAICRALLKSYAAAQAN